jgi:hypothetical protein
MNIRMPHLLAFTFLLVPTLGVHAATGDTFPQTFTLADPSGLLLQNTRAEAAEYLGHKAVLLRAGSQTADEGLALLPGTDFQDGTIEADIAVKITTPPGVRMPGFTGIAFRTSADGKEYEMFYLRPKNALSGDQAMRNHSVQYCEEPDFSWYKLRREWPYVYESYADIQPETWIHVKIEVAGRSARIYLNGSESPSLVVEGLKGPSLHGSIGLWSSAGEESYFSNLRITPSPALPIKDGSDAAGDWSVSNSTDSGKFDGTMKLARDGNKLTGTWSGALGDNKPITGTWRDGYVELSFPAEWPDQGLGAPGPTHVVIAGWIDGDSAKGRMRIEGRADGQWTAQRKTP